MNNQKTIEKIEKQCESLQKKIDVLSGNYLTNTAKRQSEQRRRDEQKEIHRKRLELLRYFRNEATHRDLTKFENALLSGTFYDDIMRHKNRQEYYNEHPNHSVEPVQFPKIECAYQKSLIKAGINNTEELLDALMELERICELAITPSDPNAARLRDLIYSARLTQRGDIQFTPKSLAERLVSIAKISSDSKVLEPEAGIGDIADIARTITPHVDCVEIMWDFRAVLELKGHKLIGRDLFELEQAPLYDAVVMNPPFSEEIKHIKYAFGFLKPGGTLAAVCSTRLTYIKNRGYPEFKQWLEQHEVYTEKAGAEFEMTGTSTMILKIKNNAEEIAA